MIELAGKTVVVVGAAQTGVRWPNSARTGVRASS